MIAVEILLPTTSAQGTLFTEDFHGIVLALVADRFGGYHRLPRTVDVTWRETGDTTREAHRVYMIALPSLLDGGKLRSVLTFARSFYGAPIWFRYLGQIEQV